MDNIKIEKLLNSISILVLKYEDGNLMLISDILDELYNLKVLLAQVQQTKKIINIIETVLKKLLTGITILDVVEIFTCGFDLISKFVILDNKVEELLNTDIKAYEIKYKEFISEGNDESIIIDKNSMPIKKENFNLSINSESFKIFIIEAEEKLISAQDLILKLEKELKNKEIINELFRVFHTIKGECGFLKLASLGELAHNVENLLDLLRGNELENNSNIINILLNGIDFANQMIDSLKKGDIVVFNQIKIESYIKQINEHTQSIRPSIGEILEEEGKLSDGDVAKILQEQKESVYTKKFGEIALEDNLLTEEEISESLEIQKSFNSNTHDGFKKIDPIIKVKASQVNYLVDIIGELLIAENQLEDKDKNVMQIKKITKEMQLAAMQLRTIKIKNLFINMRRVVRDISINLNKKIFMDTIGEELEIDRNLVEILDEPLVHLLRNAVSHGIEDEQERIKNKKNSEGKITLKAERRGNSILISVKDDGAGLNEEKILEKAVSKKLISKEKIKSLSKNEIYQFIFLPGFSTAKTVDSVSGRGVGLDIVKSVVSSYRGKIDINTEKDQFTEIIMSFPLSMAIIEGMIVKLKETFFIIPVSNIIESLSVEENMIHKIKDLTSVIDLRQEIIPVIDLNNFFHIDYLSRKNKKLAVIVENREKKYALIVDDIIAKKEIVIKPLGNKFKDLKGISSGTILQGGKIGLILDIDLIVNVQKKTKTGE